MVPPKRVVIDPEHSISLLKQSLEATRVSQGEDHPDTIQALRACVNALRRQEMHAEAEPLLRELLAKRSEGLLWAVGGSGILPEPFTTLTKKG